MVGFFRLILCSGAVYLFYLLGYPEWEGTIYHVFLISSIVGAAAGFCLLMAGLDITSRAPRLTLELLFAAAVALSLGATMPQKSGKSPIAQWQEGRRPTQTKARDGFTRLGVNPNNPAADRVISLFPKH